MYRKTNTWWPWNQGPLLYDEGAAHAAPYMVGATLAVALVGRGLALAVALACY